MNGLKVGARTKNAKRDRKIYEEYISGQSSMYGLARKYDKTQPRIWQILQKEKLRIKEEQNHE
jgi:Mor family transcriptional regulator